MASRASIEFDFSQAMAQADNLDRIADNLSMLSGNRFGMTMQNLSVSWKGDSASQYLRKGEKLQGKMNATAKELRGVASDIRRIAKAIYDAEMAALEIALKREYL